MKSATVCYSVRCDSFYYYFTDLNTAMYTNTVLHVHASRGSTVGHRILIGFLGPCRTAHLSLAVVHALHAMQQAANILLGNTILVGN